MPAATLLALFAACIGCRPASPVDPRSDAGESKGGGARIRAVLQGLAERGSAIYSFRFDGPPPMGDFYTAAIHDTDTAAACARYGAESSTNRDDFWLLELDVNDNRAGSYDVSLEERVGGPATTTNLTLLHRRNGAFVESYDAVSGSVVVSAAPTPEQSKAGASLEARIEIDFPESGLSEVACRGGGSASGGQTFSECTCRDVDGVESTCTPVNGENCCHDRDGPRFHVSIPLHASPCSAMCRWVAGAAADYCDQYFGR